MSDTLRAGSARVDITPPLTIPYLGFVPRHGLFQGVHDPLYARALALDDEAQAVVISADAIGFDNRLLGPGRDFTEEVRERVSRACGVPTQNVMLTATHAHSTPETLCFRPLSDHPGTMAWLEVLLDQLASAAIMAWRDLHPCRAVCGFGVLEGLAVDRRARLAKGGEAAAGEGVDTELGVLLLQSGEGEGCLVVSNFACHPVTVQVNPLVSADFPGAAMRIVEETLPGCRHSLFLQGCDGDINPVRPNSDFTDVERFGLMLAGEVIKTAARLSASDQPPCSESLAVASESILLPSRSLPPLAEVQAEHEDADRRVREAKDEADRQRWAQRRRLLEEQLVRVSWGDGPVAAEVWALRLGDLALVGLSCEPFSALGRAIKQRSPAALTLVAGYANGYVGYIPDTEAWEEGGYEVSLGPWARVGPGAEAMVVDKAVELLQRLWS